MSILSLIRSSLRMNCLTVGWNEFKPPPYFLKVLSVSAGAERTNIMMSRMRLMKELQEELVRKEFTKEKDFIRDKWKNWSESVRMRF